MMDHHTQGSSEVKKALQETVKLDDGRYGYIITELVPSGCVPRWHCHVCGKTISSERALHIHLSHPIHKSNLRVSTHPASNFKKFSHKPNGSPTVEDRDDRDKSSSWSDVVTDVLPGEPVPPGMEDIVEGVCQIQKKLDSFKDAPLIGLEYIVELVSQTGEGEPRYACLICEKRGDPRSVMVHLTSQNHYLKYISCFFRSAGNALNMIERTPENRKGIFVAINKVAEEIEKNYGRLKPTSAIAETFTAKKYEILREIDEKEHFRETPNTTFLHLVHPNAIKQFAVAEEKRLSAQVTKLDVSNKGSNNKGHSHKGPPPLTNPPQKVPPPLTNPPLKVPPPLKNPPQKVPPPLKNQPPKGPPPFKNPPQNAPPPLKNPPQKVPPSLANQAQKGPPYSANQPGSKPLNPMSRDIKSEKKFAFQIGKPEKSFGRNNKGVEQQEDNANNPTEEDSIDDDVIFVGDNANECIEVKSLSSISSASDNDSLGRSNDKRRDRRNLYRTRSPDHRNRRRSPSYGSYSRSSRRSRSRSRDRFRDRKYRRSRSRRRYEDRYSEDRDRRKGYSPERSYDRRRSPPRRRERSPENKRAKFQESVRKESDKYQRWEKYRSELSKLEMEYDEKLKYFEDRPEKHPCYSEEWKNFWNRRYKEIQQSGKDPSTYDFKPEWIVFWGKRMKEINEQEFNKRRDELTKEMGVDNIRDKAPSSELQDISPPTPEDARDITVDDIRNTWKAMTGSEIAPPDKRPPSPWEDERKYYNKPFNNKKPPRNPQLTISTPVVHCLRTLSVLENQLGSLGPKVLDLLAQALSLERTKESESMTLLYDQDIHIFFETVKEKVRGQLLAGIVERSLVNSCYSVISAIENMLHAHPPKPKKLPVLPRSVLTPLSIQTPKPSVSEPVQVPGIGMIDKVAVAQQIAGALIAQGKTDVTQEELEDLINAVVGIARASNATVNQDTSTADFFSQLNLKNSTADSHINELLGNMISTVKKTANVETKPEPPVEPEPAPEPVADKIEEDKDEELKEKLINFSQLSREEQQELIAMLKDLETTQPDRVEGLRKYVSIGLTKKAESEEPKKRLSPFSSRTGNSNPPVEDEVVKSIPSDDDDDDYSFEDVYKAASEKLKTKETKEEINEDSNSVSFHPKPDEKMPTPDLPERSASQMSQSSGHASVNEFFANPFPSDQSFMEPMKHFEPPPNLPKFNYGEGGTPQFGAEFAFPYQQNWGYNEMDQRSNIPPHNQFMPRAQNFPPPTFNQAPPRNFGNYYGNQYQ